MDFCIALSKDEDCNRDKAVPFIMWCSTKEDAEKVAGEYKMFGCYTTVIPFVVDDRDKHKAITWDYVYKHEI